MASDRSTSGDLLKSMLVAGMRVDASAGIVFESEVNLLGALAGDHFTSTDRPVVRNHHRIAVTVFDVHR